MTGKEEIEGKRQCIKSLSENEAKIYDRQIRLWGVRAQQRLMSANVLIIGMSCINVEMAKNLVLAGIKVTLVDGKKVTFHDVTFNYFLRESDIGKIVGECTAARLAEINHLASVKHLDLTTLLPSLKDDANSVSDYRRKHFFLDEENEDKLKEFLKDYSTVCVAAEYFPFHTLIFLDKVCRLMEKAFFCSFCCGKMGIVFSDMKKHFIEESETGDDSKNDGEVKNDIDKEKIKVVKFSSLDETLNYPMVKFRRNTDPTFFFMFILFGWEQKISEKINLQNDGEYIEFNEENFLSFAHNELKNLDVQNVVTDEELKSFIRMYRRPFQPSAAILGGLVAQEIRKFITKENIPTPNCISFNANTSQASVVSIP